MLKSLLRKFQFLHGIIGISVVDQALVSGINFITGLYLAYKLGIAGFGQYSLIILITQFCIEMQRATVNSPMFVFAAHEENSDNYLASLFPLQFLISIFLCVVAGLFIYVSGFLFEKWQINNFCIIASVFTFARMQQEFYRRYFFAQLKAIRSLFIDIGYCAILVGGLITLVTLNNVNIPSVLYVSLAASFVPLLFFKIKFNLSLENLRTTAVKHYHFSKWLLASSFASYLSSNLLLFIGSAIIGSSAAGILKLSQYIMGIMVILYQAIENIIPYRFAKFAHAGKITELKAYFFRYLQAIYAVTIAHGIFIYTFLDPILYQINGGPYSNEQHDIAIGYIIFSFLLTITYSLQYLLRAFQKTRPIFLGSLTAACVIALIGKALIVHFGVIGILLGFFVSQSIIICIYLYFTRNIFMVSHENRPYPIG